MLRPLQKKPNEAVFKVSSMLNKLDIKQYLEKIYGLDVLKVNTMNYLGKVKRVGRSSFRRSGWKKAIVTLDHEWQYPEPKTSA